MARCDLQLTISPKWWFRPALSLAGFTLWAGLIRDADSAEHWGGKISAQERVARWLADFAFRVETR